MNTEHKIPETFDSHRAEERNKSIDEFMSVLTTLINSYALSGDGDPPVEFSVRVTRGEITIHNRAWSEEPYIGTVEEVNDLIFQKG